MHASLSRLHDASARVCHFELCPDIRLLCHVDTERRQRSFPCVVARGRVGRPGASPWTVPGHEQCRAMLPATINSHLRRVPRDADAMRSHGPSRNPDLNAILNQLHARQQPGAALALESAITVAIVRRDTHALESGRHYAEEAHSLSSENHHTMHIQLIN